jgi:ParB-like chromosome segregation protein Spo0J
LSKKIESMSDLRGAAYNPRQISSRAAASLSKSLESYGDLSGIVINARTGNIVCGHQRVDQLRKLGATMVDGVIRSPNGDEFRVRVVDWDEIKEKAANVTANNAAIGGEFTAGLGEILDEIKSDLGDDLFESLSLDKIEIPSIESDDIDLGDGEIKEKPGMEKYTIFIPTENSAQLKKQIKALLEEEGGVIV